MATLTSDTTVIGGGLAGLLAASRLGQTQARVVLVDEGLPGAKGKLGGFARFSGAKFSLPPAGLGLVPVLGGLDVLDEKIAQVLDHIGLASRLSQLSEDIDATGTKNLDDATSWRSYQSIVLDPQEIEVLLDELTRRLPMTVTRVYGKCINVIPDMGGWCCQVADSLGEELRVLSGTLVFAGGRTASPILSRAGAKPTSGKGIDLGIRVEFHDHSGLNELSRLGPDAKVLHENCRTFCLNVPGMIYRYSFGGLLIPGGIVAKNGALSSNVGILCRQSDREYWLRHIMQTTMHLPREQLQEPVKVTGSAFGDALDLIVSIYGESVADSLSRFASVLADLGLVDWKLTHYIHIPLLDWYWETFSRPATFETSLGGIYAIGDGSGHARGLLQAAVSGWAVAEGIGE